MKFSKLLPQIGSYSGLSTKEKPVWMLSFHCPLCQHRTNIAVSGRTASDHVWNLVPEPLAMLGSIQTKENNTSQWARIWDGATIEPSMQDLPHPRQVKCTAHFTVTKGEVAFH